MNLSLKLLINNKSPEIKNNKKPTPVSPPPSNPQKNNCTQCGLCVKFKSNDKLLYTKKNNSKRRRILQPRIFYFIDFTLLFISNEVSIINTIILTSFINI